MIFLKRADVLVRPPTKGYLDLMHNASGPSASLLEGMVVLWATEHVGQRQALNLGANASC